MRERWLQWQAELRTSCRLRPVAIERMVDVKIDGVFIPGKPVAARPLIGRRAGSQSKCMSRPAQAEKSKQQRAN